MEETLISFETAVLAKEKRFRESCKYCYREDGFLYSPRISGSEIMHSNILDGNNCSAPTQSLLQKWLRDKHSIHISLFPNDDVLNKISWEAKLYETNFNNEKEVHYLSRTCKGDTYEEALEAGLFETLKLIK